MRQVLVRSGFAFTALVATLSCGGYNALGPDDIPPGPPLELLWTVSGMVRVHEASGVRPAASGSGFDWVYGSIGGYGKGSTTGRVATDAEGHFQFTIPAKTNYVSVHGASHQPCVARVQPTRETIVDIDVISDPSQLGAHLPLEFLSRLPLLSGMVFEQTASGRRPLANVEVGLSELGGDGASLASSLTDEQGKYTFCAVTSDLAALTLVASSPGFSFGYLGLGVGGLTGVDVELRRLP